MHSCLRRRSALHCGCSGSTVHSCAVSRALFDLSPARAVLVHHQAERIARQQLEAQMRQVQEDARNAQMSLVSQNGSLEGQCRAATERMKQLEVGRVAGDRLYVLHAPGCHEHNKHIIY
jgi:hypothetical protein